MNHLIKASLKGIFLNVYHKEVAQLNQLDQNIEFVLGERINYHQIGNGYLEFDITVRKSDGTNFHHDDPIRVVNTAHCILF